MRSWLKVIVASLILAMPVSYAISDYQINPGSTSTVFAFTCFVNKICPASVPVTSAGVEISPATAALQTTGNTSLSTIASNGATSALQTTGNSSLATIATNTGAATPAGTNTIGNVINVPTGTSGNALTSTSCGSAVSSCVLKASAGNLYGAYAECTSACWLMVFNSTSAPSNGATTTGNASGNLVECIDVSAGSSKSLTYPIFPRAFSVGITVAISSTACATLTLSTVGFVSGGVL